MSRVQKYRNTPKGNLTNTYSKMRIRNRDRGHGELPFTLQDLRQKSGIYVFYDVK